MVVVGQPVLWGEEQEQEQSGEDEVGAVHKGEGVQVVDNGDKLEGEGEEHWEGGESRAVVRGVEKAAAVDILVGKEMVGVEEVEEEVWMFVEV